MENNLRILIATDYSKAAKTAERYAVEFARHTDSRIIFLHVYDASANSKTAKLSDKMKIWDELHDSKLVELKNHCEKLLKEMGVKQTDVSHEYMVLSGNIGKRIAWEAKSADVSLVFMATHKAAGIKERIFAGHTWEMIKKLNVPVLAIPENSAFKPIEKIVFAAGGREGEIPPLRFLTSFVQKFEAEITVLHVVDYDRSNETETGMFKKFEKEIRENMTYEKLHIRNTHGKNVIEGLQEFCREQKTDWLVMSPEKRSFIEKILIPDVSLTRKMSFKTDIPLLSIPEYYDPKYANIWQLFEPSESQLQDDL